MKTKMTHATRMGLANAIRDRCGGAPNGKSARSIGETVRDIPVRMRQTRIRTRERKSRAELLCQIENH